MRIGVRRLVHPPAAASRNTRWAPLALALACAAGLGGCSSPAPSAPPAPAARAQFVGSASCESCHRDIYTRWKTTLMANVVRDPKQQPDAVVGDFSTPNPLVTFKLSDVAFTYGSKWKQ